MNCLNLISNRRIYIVIFLAFILGSCDFLGNESAQEEKVVLAEVNGEKLYAESLSDLDFSAETKEDSIRFVEIFVDRWVRDELLLHEAKEQMEDHPKVQELVEKYRNSLLLHEYEKQVINELLDSAVSQEEMKAHYEENKESYILNQSTYRALWIFTGSSNINLDSVRVNWERNDTVKQEAISSLAELYAKSFNLNHQTWWKRDELRSILHLTEEEWRNTTLDEASIIEREEGKLILKIIDKKEKGEYAPISYIEDNIRRFILHERKERILKKVRNDLFRTALENHTVKINIK